MISSLTDRSLAESSHQLFRHIHVVLVEPGNSLNIGAVARAMSNLGFSQLHLVDPPRLDWEKAKSSACWAAPLLETATVHNKLEDALIKMQMVVGFTARHGRNRPRHWLLTEWAADWSGSPLQQTALLFGAEDHGLTQTQLEHCHLLVRIPSLIENPSFNLSQAVLLALFELSRMITPGHSHPSADPHQTSVSMGKLATLDTLLAKVLWLSGFYARGTPRPVPGLVRRMLRRLQPDERELNWLLGILSRIEGTLSKRLPLARGEASNPVNHPLQSKQSEPQAADPPLD